MIGFYLGGFVATAVMQTGGAIADRQSLSPVDCLSVVFWPLTLVAFLIDVARGWRA